MADTKEVKQEGKKPSSGFRSKNEGKRRYREKGERPEKVQVTLDTVIPELPPKDKRLKEPSEEAFEKQMDQYDKEINQLHDSLHKFIEEKRRQARNEKDKGKEESLPLKDLLKTKQAERKELSEEYNKIKAVFDEKKKHFLELEEKADKYRAKMKNKSTDSEEIEKELNYLKDLQKNGNITLSREKEIIKTISDLEKILPYAAPLKLITTQLKTVRQEKAALGKQVYAKRQVLDALYAEIDGHRESLNALRPQREDVKQEEGGERVKHQDPEIQAKKEETFQQVKQLKEKKKTCKDDYYTSWDKFEEQKELIKQIEWQKKIKERLVKQAEWEKKREQEQKLREEELKQMTGSPYQDEMNLCDLLVEYCHKLKPTKQVQEEVQVSKVDMSQVLQSKEWKKDNCTVVESKKNVDDLDKQVGGKKKKGKRQNKPQEQEQQTEAVINHQMDVLGFFDQLKVAAPHFLRNVDDTISQLEAKKKYYSELPAESLEKQAERQNQSSSPKKPQGKNVKNSNLDFNEQDFPEM